MAWIEVHQALRDHRKTQALAVQLDMPEPHVIGHLMYLWLWALDNAPDGRLPRSARIIARAAWWEGEGDTWVAALRMCGWIDDEDGDFVIHDWSQYAGRLIDRRRAEADKQKRFRERRQNETGTSPEPTQPVTGTSPLRTPSTVPNPTVPNPTVPTLTPSLSPPEQSTGDPPEKPGPDPPSKKVTPSPKTAPTRVPEEFEITDDMWTFTVNAGFSDLMVRSETEKFLDHFRAKGEKKSDWVAAWRNWLRRSVEFAPRQPTQFPTNSRSDQAKSDIDKFRAIGGSK